MSFGVGARLCISFIVLAFVSSAAAQEAICGFGVNALSFDNNAQEIQRLRIFDDAYDEWQSFSLIVWINVDSSGQGTTRPIAVKTQNDPETVEGVVTNGLTVEAEFALEITRRNRLRFRMGCDFDFGFDVEPEFIIPTGQWIQVAVTMDYEAKTARLYLDGNLIDGGVANWSDECINGENAVVGPYRDRFTTNGPLVPRKPQTGIQLGYYHVQNDQEGPRRFHGLLDDVRVFNKVLTSEEIKMNRGRALVGDEEGLISQHHLNEGAANEHLTEFPWENVGASRIAPDSVNTIMGIIEPSSLWTKGGIFLDYPDKIAYTAGSPRQVGLYAIPTASNLDESDLFYRITAVPAHGTLRRLDGNVLNVNDVLSPGATRFPEVTFTSNNGYRSDDFFEFTAFTSDPNGAIACRVLFGNGVAPSPSPTPIPSPPPGGEGCDGVAGSGKVMDACGECGGKNRRCAGCDGIPYSGLKEDACGVCNGTGESCADCDGVPNGPNPPNACGVCFFDGVPDLEDGIEDPWFCLDCSGCPWGDLVVDECGKCGGDNTACLGCDKDPNGLSDDACGECGGDNSLCTAAECEDLPNALIDECDVCNGDDSTCSCVFYKNYHVATLDCTLLEYTLANTMDSINELLGYLQGSMKAIRKSEPLLGHHNPILQDQIYQLNEFAELCITPYCAELSRIFTDITEFQF